MIPLRNGAPVVNGIKGFVASSLFERFWAKVRIPEDETQCWIFAGATLKSYGNLWDGKKSIKAHRFSWELHNAKEIPKGLLACHTCDNPLCVNPHHLFLGTMSDNLIDACKKGRHVSPRKTHCIRGHERNDQNIRTDPKSRKRFCKLCLRELQIARRKAAAIASETLGGK